MRPLVMADGLVIVFALGACATSSDVAPSNRRSHQPETTPPDGAATQAVEVACSFGDAVAWLPRSPATASAKLASSEVALKDASAMPIVLSSPAAVTVVFGTPAALGIELRPQMRGMADYALRREEGPDFDVWKMDLPDRKARWGLYVGHHPQFHPDFISSSSPGRLVGLPVAWSKAAFLCRCRPVEPCARWDTRLSYLLTDAPWSCTPG